MALPEKRDELNQVDAQSALRRMERREEEHRAHGHEFAMDIHPERYPRESLSRIEEGILEDDEVRDAHDHLGFIRPDVEARIEDRRNLSRLLVVLGACLLGFAWVLLLWVGWDIRSGKAFFTDMCGVAFVIGLALIVWGYVERRHVARLLELIPRSVDRQRIEERKRERELRESDTAA